MSGKRENVKFASGSDLCAGWLYKPTSSKPSAKLPAVVLGHGLGAVKEMCLDKYAEAFTAAGYLCLCFDYRYFGESGGKPRQLLDINSQLKDWTSALDYVSSLEIVDKQRIGIFGSSFGGGHVITTAARDPRVSAAISQCPFTMGLASAMTLGVWPMLKVLALAVQDQFFTSKDSIVPVALAGSPGETALMNAPDVFLYRKLVPEGLNLPEVVSARLALHLPFYNPGWDAKNVKCPILFGICGKDSVAPSGPTHRYAKQAPKGEIKFYQDMGHFDIYLGEYFDRASADYVDFLKQNL